MTSTEKLLKKEFKIKSEIEFYLLIEKKPEAFFKNNFFTDKANYLKMIKQIVAQINHTGDNYSEYSSMAGSGSIIESYSTSSSVSLIKKKYISNRKKLVNHARFFVK
jgi:hypothetical protein